MKLEITKEHKKGNRTFKKGKTFDVPKQMLRWKAEELIGDGVAKYIPEVKTTKTNK